MNEYRICIGTYSSPADPSVHFLALDKQGKLTRRGTISGAENPSFLAIHPSNGCLYAVSEIDNHGGGKTGAVFSCLISGESLSPRFLNSRPTDGTHPCHLLLEQKGEFLIASNYGSGSVAVFRIGKDGSLGEKSCWIQWSGSGPNRDRQEGPHAHSCTADNTGRHFFACDLGTDRVMIYSLERGTGVLVPSREPWLKLKDGSGPRHLVFSADNQFGYVVNELDSTVSAFAFDEKAGRAAIRDTVSCVPPGSTAENFPADIHISGEFLYVSNRGHDSIAVFRIDSRTGGLERAGFYPVLGAWPRSFAIDPGGDFLVAANQNSDSVVVFKIDKKTGGLSPHGEGLRIPKPACVKFY